MFLGMQDFDSSQIYSNLPKFRPNLNLSMMKYNNGGQSKLVIKIFSESKICEIYKFEIRIKLKKRQDVPNWLQAFVNRI